jgi:uncharacterized protein YyaL (SSP411 family)
VPTLFDYAMRIEDDEMQARSTEARRRARRMANWLLTMQFESGAFPAGVDPGPASDPSVFNTGQILFGLLRAFRETGDRRFLDAVERASVWLIDVQHQEGYWNQFDYRGEIHSYCSRVAWALLEAHDVTGNDAFSEGAITHLKWVTSTQTDTDWFEYAAFSPKELPYLHTIAYTVRGLLEGGLLVDNDALVSAARATADRLLKYRQKNGELLGAYDRSWNGSDFHCLTGSAQTALIWLRLYDRFEDKQYLDEATAEIEFLKTQHLLEQSSELEGGLQGSQPVWGPYMRFRYPNWAVKFFCDAIVEKSRVG